MTSGSVEPGTATTATSPGSRSYSGGSDGMSAVSGLGDGEAVGARRRAVEGHEQPVLHLLGQVVLERGGQAVGLVPGVAEHVGQEALDDAVAADGGHRRRPARRRSARRPCRACGSSRPRSASRLTVAVAVPGATPSASARAPVDASWPSFDIRYSAFSASRSDFERTGSMFRRPKTRFRPPKRQVSGPLRGGRRPFREAKRSWGGGGRLRFTTDDWAPRPARGAAACRRGNGFVKQERPGRSSSLHETGDRAPRPAGGRRPTEATTL